MSHSIDLPGGTVEFHDANELTVRMTRPVEELSFQMGDLLQKLARGGAVTGAADAEAVTDAVVPVVEVSERQAHLLGKFSDVVTFMWLKSWTLDVPFPKSPDGLLDLNRDDYDAISRHAGELYKADMMKGDAFELSSATVEDVESPIGVSDG